MRGRSRTGLVVGALAVVCGCSSSGSSTGAAPALTPASGLPNFVTWSSNVGAAPCAVEGGFGSIWVSVYGDNRELRVDPASHRTLARFRTGASPCGVAVGGGSVWVENFGGDSVTRIDPKTNRVAATVKVGSGPYDVTYLHGAAWVTNYNDNTVSRIDAATNRTRTIKVGGNPTGVAPAGGAVWVTNQLDGTISRIDPKTLAVRTTRIDDAPSWTSWGDGRLWVSDFGDLDQVDPSTGRRTKQVDLGGQLNDGDIVGGKVWITDASGQLHEVDAATGRVLGSWPLKLTNPFVLAGYAGKLWVVDFKGTNLDEIDPSRLS